MIVILDHRDIDIDDVAALEFLRTGNAVADRVIDRGTDRFRKSLVIQRCGNDLLHIDHVVVTDAVQLVRGYTGDNVGLYHFEHLRRQAAGNPHFFYFIGRLDADAHRLVCGGATWASKGRVRRRLVGRMDC